MTIKAKHTFATSDSGDSWWKCIRGWPTTITIWDVKQFCGIQTWAEMVNAIIGMAFK